MADATQPTQSRKPILRQSSLEPQTDHAIESECTRLTITSVHFTVSRRQLQLMSQYAPLEYITGRYSSSGSLWYRFVSICQSSSPCSRTEAAWHVRQRDHSHSMHGPLPNVAYYLQTFFRIAAYSFDDILHPLLQQQIHDPLTHTQPKLGNRGACPLVILMYCYALTIRISNFLN